jgi:hypothetical protein
VHQKQDRRRGATAAHKQPFLVVRPVPELLKRKVLLPSVSNDGLILLMLLQAGDASIKVAAPLLPQRSGTSEFGTLKVVDFESTSPDIPLARRPDL